jgi:hypothetical protein
LPCSGGERPARSCHASLATDTEGQKGGGADKKNPCSYFSFPFGFGLPDLNIERSIDRKRGPVEKRAAPRKAHDEKNLILGVGSMDDP